MLEKEFLSTMDGLDEQSALRLQRQGVPDIALNLWPGPVGAAAIETHPLGIFDFAETGRPAYIQPVLIGGAFTDIIDLVAWYPEVPGRWWTRCYTGIPLGVDQLDRAEIEGLPLAIRRTPLSWLQVGGDGVVVTDWAMSALALRSVPILIAEDAEHGRDIQRRLTLVAAAPEIRITKSEAA